MFKDSDFWLSVLSVILGTVMIYSVVKEMWIFDKVSLFTKLSAIIAEIIVTVQSVIKYIVKTIDADGKYRKKLSFYVTISDVIFYALVVCFIIGMIIDL